MPTHSSSTALILVLVLGLGGCQSSGGAQAAAAAAAAGQDRGPAVAESADRSPSTPVAPAADQPNGEEDDWLTEAAVPAPPTESSVEVGSKNSEGAASGPTACSMDAHCELTVKKLEGKWACCGSCGYRAANASWLNEFEASCGPASRKERGCPKHRCRKSVPSVAKCEAGICVVVAEAPR